MADKFILGFPISEKTALSELYQDGSDIGIGTDNPDYTLDVAGEIGLDSYLRHNGDSDTFFGFSGDDQIKFRTSGSDAMRISSGGDVLFGTDEIPDGTSSYGSGFTSDTSQTMTLRLATSTSGAKNLAAFYNPNGVVGKIQVNGTATSFITSSDYRLKENVTDLTNALDRLDDLNVKRFNFISDANTTVDGFLAHEVQTVVPEAVSGTHNEVDDDGNPVYQGIDQSKLVPLLTAALQEAHTLIKDLTTRIETLEN